jgi:Tol biopolymer transport system component
VSDEGGVVAFLSSATNLVAGADANGGAADVYTLQTASGTISRVSVDDSGVQYPSSRGPAISGDGRSVVFVAVLRGLEAEPAAPRGIFLRDTVAGRTSCVSCAASAGSLATSAFAPHLSADGRIVAFAIASGAHGLSDIAVHDRASSATDVITRSANARSLRPRLSGNGRYVVFESWASNLSCGRRCADQGADENLLPDVYRYDRESRQFSRLSGARRAWWSPSVAPAIDQRGDTVVFSSRQQYGPEDDTVDFDLYVCSPACG